MDPSLKIVSYQEWLAYEGVVLMVYIIKNCNKKFCNYRKSPGHIIKKCSIHNQNHQTIAFQATYGQFFYWSDCMESKSCLNDSAASNHMTSSANLLKNLCPYHDSAHIQVANGNSKAITVVGDITPIFNNVSECHGFYDNLLSVAQLVDNNCDVNFSCDGGCVQNQVSEAMIAKEPKVGFCFCCIPLIQIILLQLLLLSIKMKCGTDDWDIPILPFCLIIKPLY